MDIVEFLDTILEVFIEKTKDIPSLSKARYSAMQERAIGIGGLGWHSLLQSKMIPFESAMAVGLNERIWKSIKENAVIATQKLAEIRGKCPDADIPVRNSHLLAIAPNAASSYILNTSPSIEPYKANVYVEKGINGSITHINKHLIALLKSKNLDNIQDIISQIIADNGSVRNINELTDYEKDIFKTAQEIDQTWVISQAADRQKYVCQSQSLNIFLAPTERIEIIHYIHLLAWKLGLKSLYYCRSDSLKKADKVGKSVIRERIESLEEMTKSDEVCLPCQ